MAIKIHAEKVFVGGEMFYAISKISALKAPQLPVKYLKTYPHCYLTDNGNLILKITTSNNEMLLKNADYKVNIVEKFMGQIKRCGDRLMEINESGGTEKWEGKHTFII